MADPKYLRADPRFCAAHASEEAGELVAALGKMMRWGPYSFNPELPEGQRETNIDWVRREFADLREAMDRLEASLSENPEAPRSATADASPDPGVASK